MEPITDLHSKRGGVADYFAVVGVGEKLIWKHTQKKGFFGVEEQSDEEENEADLFERFYREIVDIDLVANDNNDNELIFPSVSQVQSYTDETSLSSTNTPVKKSNLNKQIPHSPQILETTASMAIPDNKGDLEGYITIHNTCPGGKSSNKDHFSVSSSGANDSLSASIAQESLIWEKSEVFDANLDPYSHFRRELFSRLKSQESELSFKDIGRKVGNKLRNQLGPLLSARDCGPGRGSTGFNFHIAYRRRAPDENERPAVADVDIRYIRLHRDTIFITKGQQKSLNCDISQTKTTALKRGLATGATVAAKVAEAGKQKLLEKYRERYETKKNGSTAQSSADKETQATGQAETLLVAVEELISIPEKFDHLSIPDAFKWIKIPSKFRESTKPSPTEGWRKAHIFPYKVGDSQTLENSFNDESTILSEPSGNGFEAYFDGSAFVLAHSSSSTLGALDTETAKPPMLPCETTATTQTEKHENQEEITSSFEVVDPALFMPKIIKSVELPYLPDVLTADPYVYIPVIAVRRQCIGEEERFHEDPALVDVAVTFASLDGSPTFPDPNENEDMEDEDDGFNLLSKSTWSFNGETLMSEQNKSNSHSTLGLPVIFFKRNTPIGFADATFATKVLDRFPLKNYKGLPLPEEELPMFCYPTGCRLLRARFSECSLPQYFGFVVKNERGDSIHVSCVSFMEPLSRDKIEQLAVMSRRRRRVSLPHQEFCFREENRGIHFNRVKGGGCDGFAGSKQEELMMGFDEMTTFENKTICLISRYPFWTAFRRFLSHLHLMSSSPSDLPVERCISHLLLKVPLPKPGGPAVLVPLPALNCPMILSNPPGKDLPLVDLPFQRLFACLDVPTIVTIVVGLLSLERKLLIVSTRPSLVLDVCELLKALLFPFDLCAPYVPRLTEPFVSCLDFPGAIFVGIYDDGTKNGLASMVRSNLPEDSAIVDLDTGGIDCSGDRYEVLKQCWNLIPVGPRSMLVSEIETLCRDAGIVPGQEPLDSQVDSAFDTSVPFPSLVDDFHDGGHTNREPLDDRAVRDAFVRFFTAALAGYERFLVPPDLDFKTSGSEWFDTQGFIAAASQEQTPYLNNLVSTQLFQLFIQRRTEDSDVHCLLFDECLIEHHSSSVPYGRLGGDVETVLSHNEGPPQMLYSLLVDQCCAESHQNFNNWSLNGEVNISENSLAEDDDQYQAGSHDLFTNEQGDLITTPARDGLPELSQYVHVLDGNPCFPQKMNPNYFYPKEPDSLLVEISEAPLPLLTRIEREVEEASRKRKKATSYRGLNNQRRCLWQLPKLMGSHFLGTWLLCIPSQVSQKGINADGQAHFLQRALGATRLLRNKQKIIPDEASYRALIVACGCVASDRRVELAKLFGLLRSDGIFPTAVTLGQYTRALAEGYSKRSTGSKEDTAALGVEVSVATNGHDAAITDPSHVQEEAILNSLDENICILEESGRRWRSRLSHNRKSEQPEKTHKAEENSSLGTKISFDVTGDEEPTNRKKGTQKPWNPALVSSSFVPICGNQQSLNKDIVHRMKLVAIWSRTTRCNGCSYIPLDEEVQSGWDIAGENLDQLHEVACPRCGSLFVPKIGYKEFTLEEALRLKIGDDLQNEDEVPKADILPPQIRSSLNNKNDLLVSYISPECMRSRLEKLVEDQGESVLERQALNELDPCLFYNFWWYCARFSLPLPLPITRPSINEDGNDEPKHKCAFASWDKSTVERACRAAAEIVISAFSAPLDTSRLLSPKRAITEYADSHSFSSLLKLQNLSKSDWDHVDLSKVLVSLVEACDKRDFKPVVESALNCVKRRLKDSECTTNPASTSVADMDCYRTILYLSKYQCTTAFHVFFPAATKPCKGYHFWCAFGTPLPVFDRLFRDAVQRIRKNEKYTTPIHDVSDVALGFRCVFGHII